MREVGTDETGAASDQDWFRFSVLTGGRGSYCVCAFVTTVALDCPVRFSRCHDCPPVLSCGHCRSAPEFGKVHVAAGDIGTAAYLNLRKVSTVKELLQLGVYVQSLLLAVVLGSDDRVATTSGFLEFFSIENPYAAAERLDELAVLQLICSLRDCGASCAE